MSHRGLTEWGPVREQRVRARCETSGRYTTPNQQGVAKIRAAHDPGNSPGLEQNFKNSYWKSGVER